MWCCAMPLPQMVYGETGAGYGTRRAPGTRDQWGFQICVCVTAPHLNTNIDPKLHMHVYAHMRAHAHVFTYLLGCIYPIGA